MTRDRNPTSSPNRTPSRRRVSSSARWRSSAARPYRVPGFLVEAARSHREARPDRRPDDRRLRPLVLRAAHDRRRRRQGQPAAAREQLLGHAGRASSACSTRARASRALGRPFSRIWTTAATGRRTTRSWRGSTSGAAPGAIAYHATRASPITRPSARQPQAIADDVAARFASAARSLLMLGDTSMGMINGYFGPRLLNKHGFAEHKVDQAWIIERGRRIDEKRIDDAFAFVKDKGVTFHWREHGAEDFDGRRDARAAPRLPRRPRPDRRVQGRLPRLAVSARPAPAPPAVRFRGGPVQLDLPARERTATPSPARPKPIRATRCRWR